MQKTQPKANQNHQTQSPQLTKESGFLDPRWDFEPPSQKTIISFVFLFFDH